jgi:hypothetical protein
MQQFYVTKPDADAKARRAFIRGFVTASAIQLAAATALIFLFG